MIKRYAVSRWETNYRLLTDEKTHTDILEKLITDDDASIRQLIALHPNVNADQLEKLSKDWKAEVRAQVALNPKLIPIP